MMDNSFRALVVDDNEISTMILANMLALFNVKVDQTDNGWMALEMLRDTVYDIIFMDHVMPVMDGVETTRRIRNSATASIPVVIALTSSITEEIKKQYQIAGADGVYSKPLGLMELTNILKHCCPQLPVHDPEDPKRAMIHEDESCLIESLIKDIREIDYETGLRYALGDPISYLNILTVSLRDIRTCLCKMKYGFEKHRTEEVRSGAHNLKSVFANIGAMELADFMKEAEQAVQQPDFMGYAYTKRIEEIYERLETVVEAYKVNRGERSQKEPPLALTGYEYEQCLDKVIYYIKRFDYSAVLEELELLIMRGQPEYRSVLERALSEIKDFQYESALRLLTDIKKG